MVLTFDESESFRFRSLSRSIFFSFLRSFFFCVPGGEMGGDPACVKGGAAGCSSSTPNRAFSISKSCSAKLDDVSLLRSSFPFLSNSDPSELVLPSEVSLTEELSDWLSLLLFFLFLLCFLICCRSKMKLKMIFLALFERFSSSCDRCFDKKGCWRSSGIVARLSTFFCMHLSTKSSISGENFSGSAKAFTGVSGSPTFNIHYTQRHNTLTIYSHTHNQPPR